MVTVIVRQDVDGLFGTTLRLPIGMLSTIVSVNLQSDSNLSISNPITGLVNSRGS